MIKIDDFYTIENMDDTELINYRSWLTSHLNLNDGIQNVSVYGYGSNIGRSKSIEYNARGNICRIRYYDGYTNTPLHENFPSQIEFFGDKLPVIEIINHDDILDTIEKLDNGFKPSSTISKKAIF